MQPFRETPLPPLSVVPYYPNGKVGRWLWASFFLAAFIGTLVLAVSLRRDVAVECSRQAGSCDVVTTWPAPFGTTTRSVPLATIKGTHIDVIRNRHSTEYGLSFVTSAGNVGVSYMGESRRATREAQERALAAFLANPQEPSVLVEVDVPSDGVLLIPIFALMWLFAAWAISRWALVEVEWGAQTLTIVTRRWPLPDKRRTFPLAKVRDAVVKRGRRSTFSLALVVDGEFGDVPVIAMASSGSRSKYEAAEAIRELLAKRDGGGMVEPL